MSNVPSFLDHAIFALLRIGDPRDLCVCFAPLAPCCQGSGAKLEGPWGSAKIMFFFVCPASYHSGSAAKVAGSFSWLAGLGVLGIRIVGVCFWVSGSAAKVECPWADLGVPGFRIFGVYCWFLAPSTKVECPWADLGVPGFRNVGVYCWFLAPSAKVEGAWADLGVPGFRIVGFILGSQGRPPKSRDPWLILGCLGFEFSMLMTGSQGRRSASEGEGPSRP